MVGLWRGEGRGRGVGQGGVGRVGLGRVPLVPL